MNKLSLAGALAAIPLALTAFTPGAFADDLQSDLVTTAQSGHQIDNSGFLQLPPSPSQTVDFTYYVENTNSGGNKDCDATPSSPAKVTVDLSGLTGVTASPAKFDLGGCTTASSTTTDPILKRTVTFTFTRSGSFSIPASVVDAGGSYSVNGATVKVRVAEPTVVQPPADTTAPAITASVDKSKNASGWYGQAPTVSFTCTDEAGGSGVASCTAPVTLGNGADQTVTGTATDVAGNSRSITVSDLDVDLIDPEIISAIEQTKNANGWYNSPVSVDFTCTDALSGIASQGGCTGDTTFSEGEDQFATGTATDNAGHVKTLTVSDIDVDLTDPTITGDTDLHANAAGWFNTEPTVTFDCEDILSGIDTCTDDIEVSEGKGQSFTGTAVDKAGNDSDTTVSDLNVDLTEPTIAGATDKAAAATGWYNRATGAPTVSFTCNDALSGIASCADSVLIGEGINQSATGTATDEADHSATTTVSGLKVDLTSPVITYTNAPAAVLDFGTAVDQPECEATDAVSGLDSCNVTGGGASVGDHTWTITAVDKAGNTSTEEVGYTIKAHSTKGFFSPVDMGGVYNTVKAGSTVPLKFTVFGGATGNEITSTSVVKSFTSTSFNCNAAAPTDAVEATTTGGTQLRYDTTGKQFVQNWQTPKNVGSCIKANVSLVDGRTISALFKLK